MKPKSNAYNYVIIDYLDARHHHIVQRGLIRGRVGMKVDIRDQVQLKAGYKLRPGQKLTARVKDHQSEKVLDVVPIHHRYCYYLTIHVIKRGLDGRLVRERPQYEPISGYVGDEWWINDGDYQPAGYHLIDKSSHLIRIKITTHGLSRSSVTWRYAADRKPVDHERPNKVRIQYVNQNHMVVGGFRTARQDTTWLKLHVPAGYRFHGSVDRGDDEDQHLITVPVVGKDADPQQSLVHYTIVKFSRTGRVLGCERCMTIVHGRIGNSFRFRPFNRAPRNFHLSGDPVISGIFTPKGTRLNRGLVTMMRMHSLKRQMVKA